MADTKKTPDLLHFLRGLIASQPPPFGRTYPVTEVACGAEAFFCNCTDDESKVTCPDCLNAMLAYTFKKLAQGEVL